MIFSEECRQKNKNLIKGFVSKYKYVVQIERKKTRPAISCGEFYEYSWLTSEDFNDIMEQVHEYNNTKFYFVKRCFENGECCTLKFDDYYGVWEKRRLK